MTSEQKTSGFERPKTAQVAVAEELRRAIASGELPPGTQILQERVAEQLGVSRVPVREALKRLEGEGRISYTPHQGYFVSKLDISELLEVYMIRNLLEAEAVRRSLPHLTEDDHVELQEGILAVEEANRKDDLTELTAANRRFHFALIEPCGMPRLIRIIKGLWDTTDPYRSLYFTDARSRDAVDSEHRQILKAILSGDTDQVISLLAEHRQGTIGSLTNLLDGNTSTAS
ncbi:GntR family transcriptional regulator [Nocardioides sp. AE5]|uniref:GntR family transcriptional regulator n=1 Tax=Nocardioides sp. AE5 TaxID=2962573 RepID=UPI0028820762|nr:GntR family transcriptional regulator [Nocardioides sp. AE5]MDT0202482.1 GntR family transcriptional regulator [Nocardioides sp. AE5]